MWDFAESTDEDVALLRRRYTAEGVFIALK